MFYFQRLWYASETVQWSKLSVRSPSSKIVNDCNSPKSHHHLLISSSSEVFGNGAKCFEFFLYMDVYEFLFAHLVALEIAVSSSVSISLTLIRFPPWFLPFSVSISRTRLCAFCSDFSFFVSSVKFLTPLISEE